MAEKSSVMKSVTGITIDVLYSFPIIDDNTPLDVINALALKLTSGITIDQYKLKSFLAHRGKPLAHEVVEILSAKPISSLRANLLGLKVMSLITRNRLFNKLTKV
ncbi:MAG: hypothetical protein WC744_05090 [Patescibacteria group bacterium]|jgi:hypothetical protein